VGLQRVDPPPLGLESGVGKEEAVALGISGAGEEAAGVDLAPPPPSPLVAAANRRDGGSRRRRPCSGEVDPMPMVIESDHDNLECDDAGGRFAWANDGQRIFVILCCC
jgi:hypothetical protein